MRVDFPISRRCSPRTPCGEAFNRRSFTVASGFRQQYMNPSGIPKHPAFAEATIICIIVNHQQL